MYGTYDANAHCNPKVFVAFVAILCFIFILQVDEDRLSPLLTYESESFDKDIYLFGKNYLETSMDEETTLQTLLECK